MPATAGRVRMPANNRVHSSAALQTHGIWQSAIGYDPYAPTKDSKASDPSSKSVVGGGGCGAASDDADGENAYTSFQGLLALARITGSNADETRGACKKCGRVGHLTFQCRNFLSIKDDVEKDDDVALRTATAMFDKLKGKKNAEESDESEEESESSDSDVDSEMERIIAERFGKKSGTGSVRGRSKKRGGEEKKMKRVSDDDEEDERRRREKRRKREKERRKKRSSSSSDEESESSEEERRRRRRKKRSRRRRRDRSESDSDFSGSEDDSRVGRHKKRSEKRSRKHCDDSRGGRRKKRSEEEDQ